MTASIALLVPCWFASGCGVTTTQEKDARLEVKAERTVFDPKKIELGEPPAGVELGATTVLRTKDGSAVAVEVSNETDAPVNDVPLAVGVRTDEGKQYLNLEKGSSYFETHVPSLAPGEKTTWVYASRDEIPDGQVFAQLGTPADPPLTVADELPDVEVSQPGKGDDQGRIEVEVSNDSDVPQYEMQLYAWAVDGGELRAAGTAKVAKLEGGQTTTVRLKLTGDPGGAPIEVSAPPTIFQ
ncbi:MAG: hypothetical protein U0R24_02025 [Solirubrobacterales bacterium]